MLATVGLWIAATGVVALSFECVGAAVVFFGIADLLLKLAWHLVSLPARA